jgi:predicted GNAT family N-acyltransferase
MNSLRTCIVTSDSLRRDIYRLRYEVYTKELGSFSDTDFSEKLESDVYDQYAIHIAVLSNETLAGTLRLVLDSPHGFVMEPEFTLPNWMDRNKVVEHSRGIIYAPFRGLGIYTLLLECAYQWQRENGKPICIGAPNTDKLAGILQEKGWLPFGEVTSYHGISVIPMYYAL